MKRNTAAPLILGGLAAAAFAFIYLRNKARAGQNLRFEPVDIAIDTARTRAAIFTRLFYTVKLRLVNDEPAAVVVNSVNLAATANGRPFGNLTSAERFTVPAKGSQVIALNTSIATLGAAGAILDYIRNRQPVEVTINGYVDTDLGRVTVEYNTSLGSGVNGRRAVNGPPQYRYTYKVTDCKDANDCMYALSEMFEIEKRKKAKGLGLNTHERRRVERLKRRLVNFNLQTMRE